LNRAHFEHISQLTRYLTYQNGRIPNVLISWLWQNRTTNERITYTVVQILFWVYYLYKVYDFNLANREAVN